MTSRSSLKTVKRILVRCPNWLGDVVMSTPGLAALRRAYPDAWIVGQLPGNLAALVAGDDFFDEIWPAIPRSAGCLALRGDARRVAEGRFDLGIVIPESISSALQMRFGRVGRIVGYARDPIRRWLLDDAVPAPTSWGRRRLVSRERFVARLMAAVGANLEGGDLRLRLSVTPEDRAGLDSILLAQGVLVSDWQADPPVVIAPGASFGGSKCWPAEFYGALADRLLAQGHRVILLGGPGEGVILKEVQQAMDSNPIVLDAVLDLGSLKALLEGAKVLVANDAGARHVAAAFAVPSVIFLGPTSLEKTADNLAEIEILERDFDCRPCYQETCPIDHRCLRTISVDDAERAVSRAMIRSDTLSVAGSVAEPGQ